MNMKYALLCAAICLSVVACSEKPAEKTAAPVPGVVKATTARPAAIPATLSSSEACALDGVNDQPAKDAPAADKAKLKLDGWVANVPAGTTAQQIFVELEGPSRFYFKATHGVKRPDVAAHFNKPGLGEAGWTAQVDLSEAAAGAYKVRIIQLEGQSGLVCDSKKSVAIK
jgi:hypothetical protein